MQTNIFAFTPNNPEYPEYVSINKENGDVTITVRSPKQAATADRPYVDAGATARMTIPRNELFKLYEALADELVPPMMKARGVPL